MHDRALEQGQEVTLDPLAAHVGAAVGSGTADLVDLIDEDDPGLLDIADGVVVDAVHVNQAIGLLLGQRGPGVGHPHALHPLAHRGHLGEEVGERVADLLETRPSEALERRLVGLLDLDVDVAVLEPAGPQPGRQTAAKTPAQPVPSVGVHGLCVDGPRGRREAGIHLEFRGI